MLDGRNRTNDFSLPVERRNGWCAFQCPQVVVKACESSDFPGMSRCRNFGELNESRGIGQRGRGTMKVFELHSTFGLDALMLSDRPDPTPGRGDVIVKMQAASLNYRDLQVVRGDYKQLRLPLIPVSDGAGEVVEVGSEVSRFRVGDQVCPCYVPDWISGPPTPEAVARRLGGTVDGVLAEYVCIPEHAAVRIPEHLTAIEAATLPIAGVTAWHALFVLGRLQPGQTVVVQGTGGVSTFALQLALAAGAHVIATSSSDDKLCRLRSLGEFEVVNRAKSDWPAEVLRLTNGLGADHVIDVAGGANLARSIAATKLGGVISIVGYLESQHAEFDITDALRRMVTLQALSVGSRSSFEALVSAHEQHRLHPVVDRVFPLSSLREALEYLSTGKHVGKIALTFERGINP
jgi:NADPH:quinone reductase-like Zn-dependent oxidoreductase